MKRGSGRLVLSLVANATLLFATGHVHATLRITQFVTHTHHHEHNDLGHHHFESEPAGFAHVHRHRHQVPAVASNRATCELTASVVVGSRAVNIGEPPQCSPVVSVAVVEGCGPGLIARMRWDRAPPLPDDAFFTRGSPRSPPRMA